jgi:hypothetical protein
MTKYEVKSVIYDTKVETKVEIESWSDALDEYYKLCSELIKPYWTRHNSVYGEIHHRDTRANLFNEGSITLKSIREESNNLL